MSFRSTIGAKNMGNILKVIAYNNFQLLYNNLLTIHVCVPIRIDI